MSESKKIKTGFISKALESLYSDSFSTERNGLVFDEKTKQTRNTKKDEPIIKDAACRVSFKDYDSADSGNVAINEIVYDTIIFCDKKHDVIKGDTITANRMDDDGTTVLRVIKGYAAEPKIYASHQEIPVLVDKKG